MSDLTDDVMAYETWLGSQCQVVKPDLRTKHERMASDPFMFLRATYFRWSRTIPAVCPQLLDGPPVLCVGDIHVENYGTWRDADGRQVWGVNDFDEAAIMPYTLDLLRLTCSACLVPGIELKLSDVATTVLEGYQRGLTKPRPILVSEAAAWYHKVASALVDSSRRFWDRLEQADEVSPPSDIQQILRDSMPSGTKPKKFTAIVRGGGSLGRPRFQLLGKWQGGKVVREIKSIVPSAWYWSIGEAGAIHIRELAYGKFRSPDPSVEVRGKYLSRRVSPSSRKLSLADLGGPEVVQALLGDMGRELASIHRADPDSKRIDTDLAKRKKQWLVSAGEAMLKSVRADFVTWSSASK
jgi:hypothetical protein